MICTENYNWIAGEYVNLRKRVRKQSVSDRSPLSFKFLILKRVISMTILIFTLNWVTPHLMVDDFLGGWSLTRIMLLSILVETLLYGYDAIWGFTMGMVHRVLNLVDYIMHFPLIDFPEDSEQ